MNASRRTDLPLFFRPKRLPGVLFLLTFPALAAAFSLPLAAEGGVELTLRADAERLSYEAPLVATLEMTSPEAVTVTVPDLRKALRGFAVVESFDAGRLAAGGKAMTRHKLRLTPGGEGPWKLMPFVFRMKNDRTGAVTEALTRSVTFPEPLPLPQATGEAECDLEPEWVAPGWRTLLQWGVYALGALGALGLLVAAFFGVKRLRRTLRERTLPPEVRARLELDRLLQQGLLSRGLIKRFYTELTGVVRRYFERSYALRVTRQTTQEFLAVMLQDPRFEPDARQKLAEFLESADRIKFANLEASAAEAEAAASCAGTVIDLDARRRSAEAAGERSSRE